MTPAQYADALATIDSLEVVFDAIRKGAIAALHAGVKIPRYEKDWTNPRRQWKDEEKANTLLTKLGLERADRYMVELVSPAQAEARLKTAGKWPKKERGVKQTFTPLDAAVFTAEGNPTLRKVKAQ